MLWSTHTDSWDIMGSVGLVQALSNLAWHSSCCQALLSPMVNSNTYRALSVAKLAIIPKKSCHLQKQKKMSLATCSHLSIWFVKDGRSVLQSFSYWRLPDVWSRHECSIFPSLCVNYSPWVSQARAAVRIFLKSAWLLPKFLLNSATDFLFLVVQITES